MLALVYLRLRCLRLEHADGLPFFSEMSLISPHIVFLLLLFFSMLAPLFMYEIGQMSAVFEGLHHG